MTKSKYRVICVVGNRPQFVKQAMFDREIARRGKTCRIKSSTVNTGQHYDRLMSDVFFKELGAEAPTFELGVGSGPILDQIGKMLGPLRETIEAQEPDAILTFGDTNSTIAATLAAAHSGIPCIHVEGGERLYRRRDVPEEINRVATDHLSDLILTSSRKANRYLQREGMGSDRVKYVGDIMLDLFVDCMAKVDEKADIKPSDFGVTKGNYILSTLHRVENTATKEVLTGLLSAMDNASIPTLLPMHPRIAHLLKEWGWEPRGNLKLIEPLGYFNLLSLLRDCFLVVSDSGGLTREALFAGKGCIVPLDSCWWTEAVESGLAITVGQDPTALESALATFRPDATVASEIVAREFGDGKASANIVDEVVSLLDNRNKNQQVEGPWHTQGYFSEIPPAHDRMMFTYDMYAHMVETLKSEGYRFTDFEKPTNANSPLCIMRHDIDFDLAPAVELAKLEAKLGVVSTYFLMLTTPHYNLATAKSRAEIQELRSLGHNIGLHFDAMAYNDLDTLDAYRSHIKKEASILETLSQGPVHAVSFHRPTDLILEGDPDISAPFQHSYDRDLKMLADYVSDSNGEWKHGHPLDRQAFKDKKPLHILTHPLWWSQEPMSAFERLLTNLDGRRESDEASFAANCRAFRVGRLKRNVKYSD